MLNAILSPKKFTGWHMALVMGLFFGTIITVNLTLAYFANSSWTGLVVKNSYVASQNFDAETERLKKQQAMGWKLSAGYSVGEVMIGIMDRNGQPVDLSELSAKIGRTVTESSDRQLILERQADGTFIARTELAMGIWQIDLVAKDASGNVLERAVRITVNHS